MLNTLFHGTNELSALNICESGIDLGKSNKELDFGPGFYLTDDVDAARRRAYQKTRIYNKIYKCNDKPAIVSVEIDDDELKKLSVREFPYCNDEWLYFVIANRLNEEYIVSNQCLEHNLDHKYDVVIGSIADSDVAQIANYVSNGDIDIKNVSVYDVLTDEGRTLGNQMSFHTIRSLVVIKRCSYDIVERRN